MATITSSMTTNEDDDDEPLPSVEGCGPNEQLLKARM
jgi:hypothetical protein